MPSSRTLQLREDYLTPQRQCQEARSVLTASVVTRDQWIDQNESHLIQLFQMLQEAGDTTGRKVFDKETCPFFTFCQLAYKHSFKYKKHDANYDSDAHD
jgi:hypothetical protein